MKAFLDKYSRELMLLLVGIICFALIGCGAVMLSEYSDELEEQAGVKALLYTTEASRDFSERIDEYESIAKLAAEKLAREDYESELAFTAALRDLENDNRFANAAFARYFRGEAEYGMNGKPYNIEEEAPSVVQLAKTKTAACAGYIVDRQYNANVIAFCAPIYDCPYADTLVLYYSADTVTDFQEDENPDDLSNSLLTAFCSREGEIIKILSQRGDEIQQHNNVYDVLRAKINDKSVLDDIRKTVTDSGTNSYPILIGGKNHVLSVSSVGEADASFSIVGLYLCTDIYSAGYSTVNTILGTLIIFFVMMIFLAGYFIFHTRKTRQKILTLNDIDKRIDCTTRIKFERDAAEILKKNKATSFAVVVIDMKHYGYISESQSAESVTKTLLFLKLIYKKGLQIDETFGYMGDGCFVLLWHYRDLDALSKRLQNVRNLAWNYTGALPKGYHVELFGGIYIVETQITAEIRKMIDLAAEAKNEHNHQYDFASFRIYSRSMQDRHIQNEYIETHMNSALENHDFKVFYQPKYDLSNDRPDSGEALVRWYNPERDEYMQPGVFLPLFEANGFITKLDHYVYKEVCRYIKTAAEEGQTIYPISVNVSRVTASQPDFLDYYISRKKKYNIADGFITIEFTESFAYEYYDILHNIIKKLRQNGFKCSIDDFGTGYSSYNILKELPMDEIKLDRFFIQRGVSEERDIKILTSVIGVARELNMKIVQEGVETVDQLNLLRKLGCHTIQGYYYSKPLALADYIDFMSNSSYGTFLKQRT